MGGFLLGKYNAAIGRFRQLTVHDDQRNRQFINHLHQFFFRNETAVKHDGVAAAINQHVNRRNFAFRIIMTIGNDQVLTGQFHALCGLTQKITEEVTVEIREDQPDGIRTLGSQRLRQTVRTIIQFLNGFIDLFTGCFFYLSGIIQHTRYSGF